MRGLLLTSVCGVFVWGCSDTHFAAPNPVPQGDEKLAFLSDPTPKVDLLFVIDNSGSMETEQKRLRQDFKHMMEAFEQRAGSADLHVAVVSTDVGAGTEVCADRKDKRTGGDRGEFQTKAACGLKDGATFMTSQPGGDANFAGTLAETFSCVADLGIKGCGYEHPLLAMALALDEEKTPGNKGFLRKDATLGIVFVTDEDDCSAPPSSGLFADEGFKNQAPSLRCALKGHTCNGRLLQSEAQAYPLEDCAASEDGGNALYPVTTFIDFVRGLKAGTSAPILVSAIAGWPAKGTNAQYALAPNENAVLDLQPVCRIEDPSGNPALAETAFPALRLKRFIDAFNGQGRLESICNKDFRSMLETIGSDWGDETAGRCFKGRIADVDPEKTGLQPDCVVEEVAMAASGNASVTTSIKACAADVPMPCWTFVSEVEGKSVCGPGSGSLQVKRDRAPPAGAKLVSHCAVCVGADDVRCSRAPASL